MAGSRRNRVGGFVDGSLQLVEQQLDDDVHVGRGFDDNDGRVHVDRRGVGLGFQRGALGPRLFYGDAEAAGVEAYINQVNASGGIDGKKIKYIKLDDAANASQASTDQTQLITADKAIAVFGSTLSTDCTAETPIAARYQVPTACLSVETANPYIYSYGADDATATNGIVAAASKLSGKAHPTIALMYPSDTLTGIQLGKNLPGVASAAGDQLVSNQGYPLESTDVSVPVSKLIASKPDVVAIFATGPGFVLIEKALEAGGLNVPTLYVDGQTNIASIQTLTDTNVYPMGASPIFDPDDQQLGDEGIRGRCADYRHKSHHRECQRCVRRGVSRCVHVRSGPQGMWCLVYRSRAGDSPELDEHLDRRDQPQFRLDGVEPPSLPQLVRVSLRGRQIRSRRELSRRECVVGRRIWGEVHDQRRTSSARWQGSPVYGRRPWHRRGVRPLRRRPRSARGSQRHRRRSCRSTGD